MNSIETKRLKLSYDQAHACKSFIFNKNRLFYDQAHSAYDETHADRFHLHCISC